MLLFLADLTYACPMHRLFHVKHSAPCEKDYNYVHILADGITAELISRPQMLRQLVAVSRSALTPAALKVRSP